MSNVIHEINVIKASKLFDDQHYLKSNPDVAASGIDAVEHYVKYGARECRNPNSWFSTSWYKLAYEAVIPEGINPFIFYCLVGKHSNHAPAPYARAHCETPLSTQAHEELPSPVEINSKADSALVNEILTSGVLPSGVTIEKALEMINGSALFDPHWYLLKYPDVERAGVNPALHFLCRGNKESRDPSPLFSTSDFMARRSAGAGLKSNALLQDLNTGQVSKKTGQEGLYQKMPWAFTANTVKADPQVGRVEPVREAFDLQGLYRASATSLCLIIPVYNAFDHLQPCVASVLAHSPKNVRIVLIDDASTDPRVYKYLENISDDARVRVLKNPQNLGFTRTVNRGFDIAARGDVVVVNADVIVGPRWVPNLRLAAYRNRRIGTVTALSNNAGAFSAPVLNINNRLPESLGFETISRAVLQRSLRRPIVGPTGSGFCLYIKRSVLDDVGQFDDLAFPRGYGEENDFCQRAMAQNWLNCIDDATYIQHTRSASFGEEKYALIENAARVISERYPNYLNTVKSFLEMESFRNSRSDIATTLRLVEANSAVKPRILFVIAALNQDGGTPQTNNDLMRAMSSHVEPYLMTSDRRVMQLSWFDGDKTITQRYHILKEPVSAHSHRNEEYDQVFAEWLDLFSIELVHVRHIAWHSLGLASVCSSLGVPLIYSLHDFYSICPTVKLLERGEKYCGGRCGSLSGDCRPELWGAKDVSPLKSAFVFKWRENFSSFIEQCDELVTTSPFAREQIQTSLESAKRKPFRVIPHGRDFSIDEPCSPPSLKSERLLRLLFPGSVTVAKGSHALGILRDRSADLGVEIHVLGRIQGLEDTSGIIIHGPYRREDFPGLVSTIRPHFGCIFSIWAETYCHTLSELWACGVPTIGFDIGAVGERTRESDAGWLVDVGSIDQVSELLLKLRESRCEQYEQRRAQTLRYRDVLSQRSCGWMAKQYLKMYSEHAAIAT